GALGVALDLLAQVGDVDVAGALVAVELGLPELLHDLATGKDLAGAADQEAQELELGAGQVDRLAAHGGDVADEVRRDRAAFALDRLVERPAVELAAAQLGAHAAEQLAYREGLGHVVVGADLEPDHLVDLGVLGGEDDDRHGAAGAHVAADVEAARPRHHDVEDQQGV